MAAVLRDMGAVRDVIRALPIPWRASDQPDCDGQREYARDRRLACLPALALAFSARPEVLFAASVLCDSLRDCLESIGLFAGVDTPWNSPFTGSVEIPLLGWQLLMGIWL